LIGGVVGFSGEIVFNDNLPNGTPRKLLDSSRITKLNWKPQISLEDGIASTYDWFLNNPEKRAQK
jgi:GDP-L-fucose synthase